MSAVVDIAEVSSVDEIIVGTNVGDDDGSNELFVVDAETESVGKNVVLTGAIVGDCVVGSDVVSVDDVVDVTWMIVGLTGDSEGVSECVGEDVEATKGVGAGK